MHTVIMTWVVAAMAQEPVAVVYASEAVPTGTVVRREQLSVVHLDPGFVPPGTFSDPVDVVGRWALEPLLPDLPVRDGRLAPAGSSPDLSRTLPPGVGLARLPLSQPLAWPHPGDRVDVLRISTQRDPCYLVENVAVIAVDGLEVAGITDHRATGPFRAVHLGVPRAQVGDVAGVPPEELVLSVRHPGDQAPVPEPVPRCHTPARPVVAVLDDMAVRRSPKGARMTELLRGENAFVAQLTLPPGARIPPHRDPTEEYLVVVEGRGTVTIDGVAHPIEPGSLVYMPARAKVSFVNGARPLVAYQVFAGPAPAAKYEDWALVQEAAPASPPPR